MTRDLAKADRIDGESAVERVYEQVKAMAISFAFRPGERLNELEIARRIGVSRTPLREALNRLAADHFLVFSPKQGFFRKPLSVKEIADLYDLRAQIERGAVRLAVQRASDAEILALSAFVVEPAAAARLSADRLLELDEGFHQGIAALTGNAEILQGFRNIDERIRFVHGVDLEGRREAAAWGRREIFEALVARDSARAEALVEAHAVPGYGDIVTAVKGAFARIYVGEAGAGVEA